MTSAMAGVATTASPVARSFIRNDWTLVGTVQAADRVPKARIAEVGVLDRPGVPGGTTPLSSFLGCSVALEIEGEKRCKGAGTAAPAAWSALATILGEEFDAGSLDCVSVLLGQALEMSSAALQPAS
jgi:hypothetical protein